MDRMKGRPLITSRVIMLGPEFANTPGDFKWALIVLFEG
jgi:hypothetical protein